MKKLFFIVNPTTRRCKQFEQEKLAEIFPNTSYTCRVEITQYAGHEQELAKLAVQEDYDIVVAVGGDGTVHKIIQELTFTPTALAIAPTTPGSSFAHFAGISTNPMQAIELIKNDDIRYFDVGRVGNKLTGETKFLCYFGANYSGKLAELIAPYRQKSLFHYYKSAYNSFLKNHYSKFNVDFTYIQKQENVFEFLVSNINQYGCKVKVFPYSNAQDGIFDILEIKKINFFRYIQLMFLFYFNFSENLGDVAEYHKTEKLTVNFEEETLVQMDCEPYTMKGETTIDMATKSIKIVVPKNFDKIVE